MDAFEYPDQEGHPEQPNRPGGGPGPRARALAIGGRGRLFVALLLYASWQHFELIRYGYRLEQLQQARAAEEQVNRHLKLQVQSLQRPQRIELIARRQLKMVQPGPDDAVVLERVRPTEPPDRSVVALR